MTSEQCRTARAWLNLSQARLARLAGVNISTVRDFEAGHRDALQDVRKELQTALERSGIAFVQGTKSLGILVETKSAVD